MTWCCRGTCQWHWHIRWSFPAKWLLQQYWAMFPTKGLISQRMPCWNPGTLGLHYFWILMYAYCCQVYYPVEQDIGKEATRLRAITDLFSSIIEEPCFDQLRYEYHTSLFWWVRVTNVIQLHDTILWKLHGNYTHIFYEYNYLQICWFRTFLTFSWKDKLGYCLYWNIFVN